MGKMKVLIVGNGGREHALAWKIRQSPRVEKVFIAPGNGGTALIGENVSLEAENLKRLLHFALKEKIDLTVVGPEVPLSLGIVDLFEKNGLKIFGPSKKAAKIESSKVFAKKFMKKFSIPTAKFRIFSDYYRAKKYLEKSNFPLVLKADGLAAGKGVFVCKKLLEGLTALKILMKEKKFGKAGEKIVVEECLFGQEASVICLTDGKTVLPLLPAQDHKPIFDGDRGPNTGGMGAYAPTPFVDKKTLREIVEKILKPTVWGMKKIGRSYRGALYAGLILTNKGPKVLEFNCRFGDPETQPQLMLMKSDLLDLIIACLRGDLKKKKISWFPGWAVCVVLASRGYPEEYQKGFEIKGLKKKLPFGLEIFHAGTKQIRERIITSGGRVLGITSRGKTLKAAIEKAYYWVEKIDFANKYYRKDIGAKALKNG